MVLRNNAEAKLDGLIRDGKAVPGGPLPNDTFSRDELNVLYVEGRIIESGGRFIVMRRRPV